MGEVVHIDKACSDLGRSISFYTPNQTKNPSMNQIYIPIIKRVVYDLSYPVFHSAVDGWVYADNDGAIWLILQLTVTKTQPQSHA